MGEEHFNNQNENVYVGEINSTFEEEIYWTNFKSMRFFLLLSGHDFLNHLEIPKKFSEKLRDKLPETILLIGPGGATSNVRLERDSNGTLFLKDGWKEFATAHRFLESDLLMFKYKRDSCFKVVVFDRRSLCENAGSYFVRNCDSANKSTAENSIKRKRSESSVDVVMDEVELGLQGSDSAVGTSRRKGRRPSIFGLKKRDVDVKSPSISVIARRPSSLEEKRRALQTAIRESSMDSFLVILKSYNVSGSYRLGIPAGWAKNYLTRKHQDLVLRIKDKKWVSRCNMQSHSGGGVLISGWSKFVRDNSLQKDDVCLFKLDSERNELATLDVHIFYAGEESAVDQPSQIM